MQKCYIYTRVSTLMQADGFSLDAQKETLEKYAYGMDLQVAHVYSDSSSGSTLDGRDEFQQMLTDIKNKKVNIPLRKSHCSSVK